MIGVAIVTAVGFTAVLQHEFDVVDAAVVGLTVSYALSITSSLNAVVTAFAETEREMVSMERLDQYINEIQPEVGLISINIGLVCIAVKFLKKRVSFTKRFLILRYAPFTIN